MNAISKWYNLRGIRVHLIVHSKYRYHLDSIPCIHTLAAAPWNRVRSLNEGGRAGIDLGPAPGDQEHPRIQAVAILPPRCDSPFAKHMSDMKGC